MVDRALIIHSDPALCIYSGARPSGYDLAWPRLAGFPNIRRQLRINGGANGNATVSVDNGDGTLTTELLNAPLRSLCTLLEDGETLLSGPLTRIRTGAVLQVDMEAGGTLRYTDPAPLRTTAAWAQYTEIQALPHVYGTVTLRPIRYDGSGHLWLLADHPIAGVDSVELDGREISAWVLQQSTDSAGHAVSVLETQEQIDSPSRLAVTLRGKPHQDTGVLLDRPDTVLHDFLANVCGLDYSAADFDSLRSAAQGAGLTIGGVIDDHTKSIQGWVDTICQGAGMAWSPSADGVAMLWPEDPETPTEPDRTLGRSSAPGLSAETDQAHLATIVELAYGYDYAVRDYRRTLRVQSQPAIEEYGEIERRINAGWIHSPPAALAHATRWLQYHARQLWTLTATRSRLTLAPGDSIAVDHPHSPVTTARVTDIIRVTQDDSITAEAPYGSAPSVELLGTSEGASIDAIATPEYQYADGLATFVILDDEGTPMPGARVTIDGTETRYADTGGRVQFAAKPGAHTLRIEAPDYVTRDVQVTVS